jgi:hypothetical protein
MIVVALVIVDFSIYFDHEAGSRAIEVNDEAVNWLLPSKAQCGQLVTTQMAPQQDFCWRHRLS